MSRDDLTPEYLHLFHAITLARDALESLSLALEKAQQEAEELYISRGE